MRHRQQLHVYGLKIIVMSAGFTHGVGAGVELAMTGPGTPVSFEERSGEAMTTGRMQAGRQPTVNALRTPYRDGSVTNCGRR
jgi:hypothetical protein